MAIDFLRQSFAQEKDREAIISMYRSYSYGWLNERIDFWLGESARQGIKNGQVVSFESDFYPEAIALLLALIERGCILVPLSEHVKTKSEFLAIAECEFLIRMSADGSSELRRLPWSSKAELYQELRALGHPGLVIFTSGSSGFPKAVVHDLTGILDKFKVRRNTWKTLLFLLFDHIGGINTMLYTLSNGGCLVTVSDRSPDHVLSLVERYSVEMLPASPTFLNLLILGGAIDKYNTKSLRLVTYGTEPMPESTLKKLREALPNTRLLQTYGLSEVGILRSKSKSSDSLWVKVGGEGFETRIVDGILQIKAKSAMLGYLNAPSPFTEDGWFITGDRVEVDGEYIRIMGRDSETINMGGLKVNPIEVESVIMEMPEVLDVTVYGEKHYIFNRIVCARVTPKDPVTDTKDFGKKVKAFCQEKIDSYKVPVKIVITAERQHTERFKKNRGLT